MRTYIILALPTKSVVLVFHGPIYTKIWYFIYRKLCVERDLHDDNVHKKIGIDMGKEMLKVTLTLFADDDESSSSSNTEKGPKKKDFKNTGNKRVIILASVPKVNENYSNIKILLNLLNLKLLETYWITGKTKTME